LVKALNPKFGTPAWKAYSKLSTQRHPKRHQPKPLTVEEEDRWFSFESFLQLLGLATLNQEDSGGLYALHAHLNHSCEPNLQVSHEQP
jgi:truncated hemoglobin YjbI